MLVLVIVCIAVIAVAFLAITYLAGANRALASVAEKLPKGKQRDLVMRDQNRYYSWITYPIVALVATAICALFVF